MGEKIIVSEDQKIKHIPIKKWMEEHRYDCTSLANAISEQMPGDKEINKQSVFSWVKGESRPRFKNEDLWLAIYEVTGINPMFFFIPESFRK